MKKKYKILAVVSARGGSKGIPGKNLKKLNNKPLLSYTLSTLTKIKEIDNIIVSSEDPKILSFAKSFSMKVNSKKRPKFLAKDKTPLTSVVKYVALQELKKDYHADFVLQIAPTCPFIKIDTIKKMISLLIKGNDCVVTLKRIEHEHPFRAKKLNENNLRFKSFITNKNVEKYISRQDLPTLYCTSGGIYARSLKLLKKFNEKDFNLGKKPLGVVVDDIEAINIDRQIDFDFAELISKKYRLK